MRAMVIRRPGEKLRLEEREIPEPGPTQLLIRVLACGVCRTDLHLVDGELPICRYPVVPGHEIVGQVAKMGGRAHGFEIGQRIGVPWLGGACGRCRFCHSGEENLCDEARFTGCHIDGGYQEFVLADYRFCLRIPNSYGDADAAPLLCAGLIGHRAHRMAGAAERLGIYGFGAAAHIMAQVARFQGQRVHAFTRPGDRAAQDFAAGFGAEWVGDSDKPPPEPLDAAIIFAPVGTLVPAALRAVRKGGRVITAGIHMSEIPAFPYAILWGERMIRSVANLTRADGEDFMRVAEELPIITTVAPLPLEQANEALDEMRAGQLKGAAVLVPDMREATSSAA
ncbi:MAG TPA: zinc-dependent alcohol dehydrogenase family protein [Bauldia sp.]|nr:zinc-dependent alcohol dehydrogenase family protein [Bauldia sp.]